MATANYANNNLEPRAGASDHFSNAELSAQSAVAWGAVVAGAAAAASLSLILLLLGTGLGLSSVSPWTQAGVSATTFGVSTILWLSFTQLAASGMGGYIAGRLRTRWTAVHTDEVYFRDTVHGFLAWAVASLATAALLGSVIGSIVNGGVQAGAAVAVGAATAATAAGTTAATTAAVTNGTTTDYFVDTLFRKDMAGSVATETTPIASTPSTDTSSQSGTDGSPVDTHAQSVRIVMNSVNSGPLPAQDLLYLGQLVAQRTGLIRSDAEKRVSDTYTRMQKKMQEVQLAARADVDQARKASSYAALWMFVSLLIGAFVSSYCATWGGRQRDDARSYTDHNQ